MTREEAKRRAELYSALADGKAIQVQNPVTSKWEYLDINKIEELNYRIKPEPKYRPFKNQEECWNEMLKHQPFGWIKDSGLHYMITSVSNRCICFGEEFCNNFNYIFKFYKFADGTPFGIKEE